MNGFDDKDIRKWGLIGVVFVVGLWGAAWVLTWVFIDENQRGAFGDMFGSVNALFSGLALGGIIFTILLQRKELGLQRDELKETRKEFAIQNSTLKAQRFENTFFNMLSLHSQIVNDLDFTWNRLEIRGKDFFSKKFTNLQSLLAKEEDLNAAYLTFYGHNKTDLGHYFRNLYRIIKIVDQTQFVSSSELSVILKRIPTLEELQKANYKERYKYTSIVRAQLSDFELLTLFFNCLSEYGEEKFKPLVEEYALLKNLPEHQMITNDRRKMYLPGAYKRKYE